MTREGLGDRSAALGRMADAKEPFDILVVGGGITGAGIALDAASRGMTVALVDRQDFASGTSSKSSKLVHGGLRYLEQREFGLMREAAAERDLLRRLAPHLVQPTPFVLPITNRRWRAMFGVGLWAYDALATFRNLHVHRYLEGVEAEGLVPPLPRGKLRGGFLFYDCKTDDARLVIEVLVQACRYGALVANHAAVRGLDGTTDGCVALVEDTTSAETFEVSARRCVVASGVWGDHLESLARHGARPRLRPSKGVHLVFRKDALPMGDHAAFIPDATRRRMLFVVPWIDAVIVGTTDTTYDGPLDHPTVDDDDRHYILNSLNATFDLDLDAGDIAGAYAGLRPLVAGKAGATADLSRKHAIYEIAPSIIGITGGKLTIYRRMARDLVDRVSAELGGSSKSRTRWVKLGCSDLPALQAAVTRRVRRLGIADDVAGNLIRSYGDRALSVLEIAAVESLTDLIAPGHLPIAAEAAYTARFEQVVHLSDFLARRARLALTDPAAGIGRNSDAAGLLASELRWSTHDMVRQVAAHRAEVQKERGIAVPSDARVFPSGAPSAETG